MCPKKLAELQDAKMNPKKRAGKKIDFAPVLQAIIKSGQYWGVKEVHADLVKGQVTRFRTMKLLQNAVRGGKLVCYDDKGTYYYGPVPERK